MADQFDYARLEARASALLDRFGVKACRIVRPGPGTQDAAQPWKSTEAAPPDVVVVDGATAVGDNIGYSRGKRDAPQALTGSAGGKAFMRGALDAILPGDWLEVPIGGGQYDRFSISRAEPIKPGTTTVLWELSLRS